MSSDRVPSSSHSRRILACVQCQQRKVKCDRNFPCSNCTRSRVQCVQGTLAPRRRRFPERELLDRLHKSEGLVHEYEELLRQNNIPFDPHHDHFARETEPLKAEGRHESADEHPGTDGRDIPTPSASVVSESGHAAKNMWHAMNKGFRDPDHDSDSSDDDMRGNMMKKAFDDSFDNVDQLLFGSQRIIVNLSSIHPDPVQIFRLWQIYLDNVNPLLKVTHTPTLQSRIIEAAGNLTNINPNLEALMFGIYCTSILSLPPDDCQSMFGANRKDLLMRYQSGCQQALWNCGFLKTNNRECLTALFFYLLSVRPETVLPSLSSMLAIAIRIAQRMGLQNESALAGCTIMEAEMRRRLWWSLALFDTRVDELSNSKTLTLNPTWDCKIPLNVNDSEIRPEMKEVPVIQGTSSEAIFTVVRSELGDFMRHSMFHLDFTNPALKPIARSHNGPVPQGGEFIKLEEMIEDQYLRYCDEGNPLHFMTIWSIRAYLAKYRLMENHGKISSTSTDAQRDAAIILALRMLECDTKIMTSPLTKGYLWLTQFYFPFPAYYQIIQDLKKRPTCALAEQAWELMSENYAAWYDAQFGEEQRAAQNPLFQMFSKIVLQAWDTHEAALKTAASPNSPTPLPVPDIVLSIQRLQSRTAQHPISTTQPDTLTGMSTVTDDSSSFPIRPSMPMDLTHQDLSLQDLHAGMTTRQDMYPGMPDPASFDPYGAQLDWTLFAN